MSEQKTTEETTHIEWRVHLLAEVDRSKAVIATLAVLSAIAGGIVFVGEPVVILVYLFILYFALGEFFLPIKYRITSKGVYIISWTGPKFLAWDRIKKHIVTSDGVKFSIFAGPSPFESFRGQFVRYGDKKDEIISLAEGMAEGRSTGTS